jgi:CHAT domain-containing protein
MRDIDASQERIRMKVDLFAENIGTVMNAEEITVRSLDSSTPPSRPDVSSNIKVLFLAANPHDSTQLALDEEARAIEQKIRMSDDREHLQLITAWAIRPDDLMQQLYQHRPTIVHLSGHGTTAGALMLLDTQGESKLVSAVALKALFSAMKDNIRIVLLNACHSSIQAEAIGQHIDFVIGMKSAIPDMAATLFAAAFYRALGFGQTVQQAFDQARVALLLEGTSEEDIPVLLTKTGVSADCVLSSHGARKLP